MKKLPLFLALGLTSYCTMAQDFPGARSGNYSGVNGVFSNPANIADSRYRFDLNLFSIHTLLANDQAEFNIKNFSESFDGDSLRNKIFGENAGPTSGMLNLTVIGPSAMFNIGKNSFALTTRGRVFASIQDVDGKLVDKISSDLSDDPDLPYTVSSSENMRIALNAWSEFGLSYGRVLYEKGPHFIKGGITAKYLAGVGNAYVNIDQFSGTIDEDDFLDEVYLHSTTGRVSTGFGGIRISDFEIKDLTAMESTGFGADLGFVYEYRPGAGKEGGKNKAHPYKFKLGVALLDLGRIRYEKDLDRSGGYDIDITGPERFYLEELDGVDVDDFKSFFDDRPAYFTPVPGNAETSYTVSLPTTLQVDADYHVASGFYVHAGGQFALVNSNSKVYNNRVYSGFTLTPRFEGRRMGVYLPINYNSLTQLNAGVSVRMGPLYLGSGSLLTALFGNSRQADFHLGFRFGLLK